MNFIFFGLCFSQPIVYFSVLHYYYYYYPFWRSLDVKAFKHNRTTFFCKSIWMKEEKDENKSERKKAFSYTLRCAKCGKNANGSLFCSMDYLVWDPIKNSVIFAFCGMCERAELLYVFTRMKRNRERKRE